MFRRSDEWFHLISGGHHGQELPVALIGEEPAGGRRGQPAQLVDLLIDREGAPLGGHDPVGHHLGARPCDRCTRCARRSGAAGRPNPSLPALRVAPLPRTVSPSSSLPLGKDQSDWAGTVHQRDLQVAPATADQQTAGGLYHLGRRRGLNRHRRMPSHPSYPTAAPGENWGNQRTPGIIRGRIVLAL